MLSGIALAALTGITVFAYKHPKAYEKIFPALFFMWNAIFVVFFIWNTGNTFGRALRKRNRRNLRFGSNN